MRIVLSRKGFDSACGGVASPIFPDGRYVSLPIPLPEPVIYGMIGWRGATLGPLVERLSRGRVQADAGTHLDPDLRADALPRAPGWRPAFGQVGAAQGHLDRQGVGVGDLFLFFGWFREVERGRTRVGATGRTPPTGTSCSAGCGRARSSTSAATGRMRRGRAIPGSPTTRT